jgi:hypothetical protein
MATMERIRAKAFVGAAALGLAVLLGASVEAVPVVSVSGEGLAAANAAQAAFLAGLATSTTESFESYAVAYYPTLVTSVGTFTQVSPGADEPLCSPHCSDGLWVLDAAHTPAWGRFATDGERWLDTNDSRETRWTAAPFPLPTRIGFFINDPDDAGGDFTLLALNGLGVSSSLIDLVADNLGNGKVFYVTVSDPEGLKEIRIFSNDPNDGLGIDEFTAGNPPVPEPGTMSLLGTGLLAAALRARRRRRLTRTR